MSWFEKGRVKKERRSRDEDEDEDEKKMNRRAIKETAFYTKRDPFTVHTSVTFVRVYYSSSSFFMPFCLCVQYIMQLGQFKKK